MSKFLNEELDYNLIENQRFQYVNKVLLIMIENSNEEVIL